MDVFFKPVMFIAVVFVLFAVIFIQSGTLEIKQEEYMDRGMPMKRTIYIQHWDRFTDYINNIPGRISNFFSGSK